MSAQQQRAAILRDHADLKLDPRKAYTTTRANGRLASAVVDSEVVVVKEQPVEIIEKVEEHPLRSGLVSIAKEELAPVIEMVEASDDEQPITLPKPELIKDDAKDETLKKVRQQKQKKQSKKQNDESD